MYTSNKIQNVYFRKQGPILLAEFILTSSIKQKFIFSIKLNTLRSNLPNETFYFHACEHKNKFSATFKNIVAISKFYETNFYFSYKILFYVMFNLFVLFHTITLILFLERSLCISRKLLSREFKLFFYCKNMCILRAF